VTELEVFADVSCPFAHVGLARAVAARDAAGRHDVVFVVRAWPLELVNGRPLDGLAVAEKVAALRASVAPDRFEGYDPDAFCATTIPALALTAVARSADLRTGEAVALELRRLQFDQGQDVSAPEVLQVVAEAHGLVPPSPEDELDLVLEDWAAGRARAVPGSPTYCCGEAQFFCPALSIEHPTPDTLSVAMDEDGFAAFVTACLGQPK